MTFPILGANSEVGGYAIDNSLRLNRSDGAYLSRTPGSSGNQQTFTTSFWLKHSNVTQDQTIINCGTTTTFNIAIVDSGTRFFIANTQIGVTQNFSVTPNALSRDPSAWLHVVVAIDTTQATSVDRVKIYFNGELQSHAGTNYPSLNFNAITNPTTEWRIGYSTGGGSGYIDGYLSEFVFIDGTALTPTSFAEADEDSGIWKPLDVSGLTFGTNGFYLDFEDSAALGDDVSGNGNDFTPTNLASTDQMLDTPTNNFATGNPLFVNYWIRTLGVATGSQGNLEWSFGASDKKVGATISTAGGKWYAEMRVNSLGSITALVSGYDANEFEIGYNQAGNRQFNRATPVSYGASYGAGDVIGFAVDQDNNQVTFYKNGASQGTLTNTFVGDAFFIGAFIFNGNVTFNFGQDSTFAGRETVASNTDENGYGEFHHSVPSGYLALCTQNLATELSPTIDDGSQYFDTTLHTGNNGSGRTFTGLNFQPDWIWGKVRDSSNYTPFSVDSSRGGDKFLTISSTAAEDPGSHGEVSSFNSDGTTWIDGSNGTYPRLYYNDGSGSTLGGSTYVFWQWKANGGSTSSNTDGSITSTVQANTTAGFSIVTYTGTGANATIGHGLGKAPSFLVTKARNTAARAWVAWHNAFAGNESIELDIADGKATSATSWNSTVPTSSVFSVGTRLGTNESGTTYVAYCFTDIEGYSKMGSYTGNGSTDGTFVYTGFRPRLVIWKRTDSVTDWRILDTARDTFNVADKRLFPNNGDAENTAQDTLDFLSNGFKHRATNSGGNASGGSYIYMCFAENPFVSSAGIPVTAR